MNTTPKVLQSAQQYIGAGISIIPIKRDGSKRPPLKEWNPYRKCLATETELRDWFGREAPLGIATVCGLISGNLEVMDFDEEANVVFSQWRALVEAEAPGLIAKLSIVKTPRQPCGYHVRYRTGSIKPVTTKLATAIAKAKDGKDEVVTLIETRGEGGYALAPGSPVECHENKAEYQPIEGPLAWEPPTITPEQRDILWRCAASFDRHIEERGNTFKEKTGNGTLPGDDYCQRGPDWTEILIGWELIRQSGDCCYWRRPGKDGSAWSATSGRCKNQKGHDLLAVFSTNAYPFPGPHRGKSCSVHSKFQAFAMLHHACDFKAAAAALRKAGYGSPSQPGEISAEESATSVWPDPQPIPNDLPSVLPFDYGMLPDAFIPFVSDVAERMQCPPDFPAVATMVALAGVVGKKIGIRPKRHDDWLVVPNLWGAVIGRPGIMKTPAIRQPFKFLQRLEMEAKKEYAKEQAAYEVKLIVAEEQKKQRKIAVAQAVKEGKDPEQAAQSIVVETPKEPFRRRYIVNDSTVEKLGVLLNESPNGLTSFRDEIMGLFENLGREGQEGARAFYIEAWDGLGKFTYDRIMRGTLEIESVTLSVFGGIQPGRLESYLHAAVQGGAGDDGLMQRFQMAVYPDVTKEWRNIDRWPDTEAKQRAWAVFQGMDALNPTAVGADPDADAPYLRFDHDAQNIFDNWRAELEPRIRSGEEHPALESHLAKYRSLVPSLALLIHLANGTIGPVTVDATQKALAWVRYLESHARRIYAIVTDPATAAAKALAKRITKGDVRDGFALRSVYRNAWAGLDKQSSELAVELLIELNWLKEIEIATEGRTKTAYRINPTILAKTQGEGTAKTDKSPSADPSGSNGSDHHGHSEGEWGEI